MTENGKMHLQLARDAIMQNDFMGAKNHYGVVLQENPNILEAEWFYRFAIVAGDEINSQTADHYLRLVDLFYPMLEYLTRYPESQLKHHLVLCVIKGFSPLRNSLHKAMVKSLAYGNPAISMDDITRVDMAKRIKEDDLPNKILELFGDGEPYCLMAADFWKRKIAERFRYSEYRNFQDRGKELWFDKLAKRIRKYDPSYKMPEFKQAGCISSGDAAKVRPGE